MRGLTRLFFLSVALSVMGCQHKQPPAPITLEQHVERKQAELSRAVGKLTLDEAITRWGQPASVVEGKNVTSVLWRTTTDPGGSMAVPVPMFRSLNSVDATWAPVYVDRPGHGEQVDCTFSKKSSVLQSLKYSAW